MNRKLVLFFASPISFRLGLCAGSVLNLHDRIQGSKVAARLTVGYPTRVSNTGIADSLCACCEQDLAGWTTIFLIRVQKAKASKGQVFVLALIDTVDHTARLG
jgi:hypothetical protein